MRPRDQYALFQTLRKIYWTICLIVIFVCIAASAKKLAGADRTGPRQRLSQSYVPTAVCDDAWQSDIHHEDDTITQFTVPMREGCFSGFVHIPKRWTAFTAQPVDDKDKYWIAVWQAGQSAQGPYYFNDGRDFRPPLTVFRVQGHGTVRIYTNQPTAIESAPSNPDAPHAPELQSIAHERKNIEPVSGGFADLSVTLDECYRRGGDIYCDLYAKNETDAVASYRIYRTSFVDDEGNELPAAHDGPAEGLPPGTLIRIRIKVANAHMGAKSGTFTITSGWRNTGTHYVVFKDIPIR